MKKTLSFKHTIYSSYCGYFVQAIINNFAPLLFITFQNTFFLSYKSISLLIFINFAVQLLIDFLSAYFIDKIGYRKCIVMAHFLAAAGLCFLGTLPFLFRNAFVGIVFSIVTYAIGSGLIEVIVSPLVEACPTENKAGEMSLLHSFYCWGQMCVVLFSTLFFSTAGIALWRVLAFLWAIIPLVNAFVMIRVPFPEILSENKGMSIKQLFSNKIFLICAVIMLCSGASELAMSQWASTFAESGLKVSKTIGDLLGPCLFAVLMGTARVLYSKLSQKISLNIFMGVSGALCVFSYLLASLSQNPIVALMGCAVCGLSVGVMWPGTFSLAAEKLPTGSTAMFAMLALFGDAGCSSGPSIVGAITSAMGDDLSKGLFFASFFPLLLIIMLFVLSKVTKKK
ncbi:MAG: MFS transporter [Clostridia bacterium]|nr:MFS transporter [Clostridia bacterium]